MKNKYRTSLSIVKNLGSAKSGAAHWWYQRFTAIILLISTIWLIFFASSLSGAELSEAISIIQKPYNVVMIFIFTISGFYHAVLGMQVIIEDYVHCRAMRLVLILLIQIFSIITVISFILAVLHVMNL